MTFYVEKETQTEVEFDWKQLFETVALEVLKEENCPYEAQVNLTLTDDAGIRKINRMCRQIDSATDVLSFPNIEFALPSDFTPVEMQETLYFDPDSGELLLGDIILSLERVILQAREYGHSVKREFAFLIAHSMLHLCGYDHMTKEDEKKMIEKQRQILGTLQIVRDEITEN